MKRIAYCAILTLMTSALLTSFYMFVLRDKTQENRIISRLSPDEERESDASDKYLTAQSYGKENAKSYIRHSPVIGYMMIAEEDDVNIYEMYENGYQEKIKELDINPEYMRTSDYMMLRNGIRTDSYEEICGLIEDFSS